MCRCGQERVVGAGSPDCTCVQQYFVQRRAKLRSRTYNSSSQCGLYVPFKTRALCCQSCAGDQQDGRQRQQSEAKHEKSACGCCMPEPASRANVEVTYAANTIRGCSATWHAITLTNMQPNIAQRASWEATYMPGKSRYPAARLNPSAAPMAHSSDSAASTAPSHTCALVHMDTRPTEAAT